MNVENSPCLRCAELEETHVNGKCLFGSTYFDRLTVQEAKDYLEYSGYNVPKDIRRIYFIVNASNTSDRWEWRFGYESRLSSASASLAVSRRMFLELFEGTR